MGRVSPKLYRSHRKSIDILIIKTWKFPNGKKCIFQLKGNEEPSISKQENLTKKILLYVWVEQEKLMKWLRNENEEKKE